MKSMSLRRVRGAVVIRCLIRSTAAAQAVPNPVGEDSVRALEDARGQALLRGDTTAISRMTAVEFNELTRFGTVRGRAANLCDAGSGMFAAELGALPRVWRLLPRRA